MSENNEEIEDVHGYLYTHWDCPECGEVNEVEGQAVNEEAECPACGYKVRITHSS